jgi:ankyrin repeat protein
MIRKTILRWLGLFGIVLVTVCLSIYVEAQTKEPKNDNKDLKRLLELIISEDEDLVTYKLNDGVSPNVSKTTIEKTPILLAIRLKNLRIVRLLVEKGADVNAKSDQNVSALMVACFQNQVDIVKFLIKKKVDINAKAEGGMDAILLTSQQGNIEITRLLLESGAKLDSKTDTGGTALIYAPDNKLFIKFLIEKGAKLEDSDFTRDWSALFYAIDEKQLNKVEGLLENGANQKHKDKSGATSLELASNIEDIDIRDKIITLFQKYSQKKSTLKCKLLNLTGRF